MYHPSNYPFGKQEGISCIQPQQQQQQQQQLQQQQHQQHQHHHPKHSSMNRAPSSNENIIYGVEIPNRVFVGGVAYDTTELELKNFFQSFGEIKDAKIITDRDGISKGFGFITFENEEQALKMQGKKTIYYKEKKLNIGPAIRKQGGQFPKANQEFISGQIKIFINSCNSPVYTPSSGDKISPMLYSLSPTPYLPSMPYCHADTSSRFPATSRQQMIPLNQNDAAHFVYPFPHPNSTHTQPLTSHFDQVKLFSPDHTPSHTPSPMHSLTPLHFPRYPILFPPPPPEQFYTPHDPSDNSVWFKMNESNTAPLQSNAKFSSMPVDSYQDSAYPRQSRLGSRKQDFAQLGSSFKKMSLKEPQIDATGQLTPPPSPPDAH